MRRDAFQNFAAGAVQFSGGIRTKKGFDAVDLAAESESGLDGRDVGDGEVIIGPQKVRGGLEEKTDTKVGFMPPGNRAQGVADFKVKAIGEAAGEGDGVGFGNKRNRIGRSAKCVFEPVGDQFVVGERIDAHQVQEFARMGGKGGDQGDCGCDFPDGGVLPERGDKGFRETEPLSFYGEVGTTGYEIEGGTEGAEGRLVDRLDGYDGGDSHSEGEKIEKGEGLVPEKITPAMGQENAKRGKPVQGQLVEWIRPSTKAIRRSAAAATSGL
jgi:hypothetical protein